MKRIFVVMTTASLLMTSCATVFTGTKDRITFNSTPTGATIYKDGVEQCKTPCTIRVKRSIGDTDIEYKLDGYETRLNTPDKEFNIVLYNGLKKADFKKLINTTELLALRSKKNEK